MTVYAEEVNYWKTGHSSTDIWIERAVKEIVDVGGEVRGDGFINDTSTGRAAFMLAFRLGNDNFKMIWPVLESKTGNQRAARVQAATALCHEVKAACVKVKFLGARAAFFAYLLMPGGVTPAEISTQEFMDQVPRLLAGDSTLLLEG